MTTSAVSRRGFLLGTATLGAATALPHSAAQALPSGVQRDVDDVDIVGLEAELAGLDKPIYLLETGVPETFSTGGGGRLSISNEHAKVGTHSLRWDDAGGASLLVRTPLHYEPVPEPGQVAYFAVWVYNETPLDEQLRFQFGRGQRVDASFSLHLNFRGWRTCWIRYGQDTDGEPRPDMDRITVAAPAGVGTLWIDQLITNVSLRPDRPTPDFQVPTAGAEVRDANNYHWMGLLDYWGLRQDPGFDTTDVTAAEIEDARAIRERLLTRQRSNRPYTGEALTGLEQRFAEWGIPDLADPSAIGANLRPATPGSFINDKQTEILPRQYRAAVEQFADVRPLRRIWEQCGLIAAQTWDSAHRDGDDEAAARAGQLVLRMFAHLHDQGWSTGSAQGTTHHIGYAWRSWADALLMLEPLLRERGIWDREVTTLEWYAGSGRLTQDFSENRHRSGLLDVLNTLLEGLLSTCFGPSSWEEKVGRLRAFSSWINHAFTYSPGISSGFKPDGSMYHHVGPYPLYARDALGGGVPPLLDCVGTTFALRAAGRQVLTDALRHQVLIANTLDYPLSQSGRHQTGTMNIRKLVNTHALLGRTPLDGGSGYDTKHAAMFRRLVPLEDPSSWQLRLDEQFAGDGIAEAEPPNGCWALPYGGAGLLRQDDWLVTIRGHNRYLWSTEIYDQNNVYGRYQTYGQISVQTDTSGDGWVSITENGDAHPGYDWNFIPGATTKTLPFDELAVTLDGTVESMPLTQSRFGGSGTLAGYATIFGMELCEHPSFDGTHTARISALMVGDRVIALGSAIRNEDTTHPTRTTLFQQCPEVMPEPSDLASGDGWVTDPAGNGYVVIAGPEVTYSTSPQTTPDESGNEWATREVALGYLDHGVAPEEAGYGYVLLVDAGSQRTADFAAQMASPDAQVSVQQRDRAAHVMSDIASQVSAHVIFEPETELDEGSLVRSASRQSMVLARPSDDGRTTEFSVTDPDLHLYEGKDEEQYSDGVYIGDESPYTRPWRFSESLMTETEVILDGRWRLANPSQHRNVRMRNLNSGDTAVTVTTQHGASVEFAMFPIGGRRRS